MSIPPLGWQWLGLCLLALVSFLIAHWRLRLRRERGPWGVPVLLGLVGLAPAWALGSSSRDALLDRFEAADLTLTEGHLPASMGVAQSVTNSRSGDQLGGALTLCSRPELRRDRHDPALLTLLMQPSAACHRIEL